MSMFNDISWGSKENKTGMRIKRPTRFNFMQKDFHQEDGHSSDLDQKRSGVLLMKSKPQGEWDRVVELMMLKFGESKTQSFPIHKSVISRSPQKQRWWKIVNTLLR